MLNPVVPVVPTVSWPPLGPVQSCRHHFVAWQENLATSGRATPQAWGGAGVAGTRAQGLTFGVVTFRQAEEGVGTESLLRHRSTTTEPCPWSAW